MRINLYCAGGGKYHRQERRHSEAISGRGKKDNICILRTTILGQLLILLLSLLIADCWFLLLSFADINIAERCKDQHQRRQLPGEDCDGDWQFLLILYQLNHSITDNFLSIMYQLNHSILFMLWYVRWPATPSPSSRPSPSSATSSKRSVFCNQTQYRVHIHPQFLPHFFHVCSCGLVG